MNTSKKVYFEFMRIVACALVIYNHVTGYYLYGYTVSELKRVLYLLLTVVTRINIPVFLMISGALLLEKSEPITIVLKKRFSRILAALIAFDFILTLIDLLLRRNAGQAIGFSPINFFVGILQNNIVGAYPYWYLYSYLGMLLVLPILQRAAKDISRDEIIVLLLVHFILCTLVPVINLVLLGKNIVPIHITDYFSVPIAIEKAMFYPLLGYYIEHKIDVNRLKPTQLFIAIGGGIVGLIASIKCTYVDARLSGDWTQDYVGILDYLIAIAFFILVKYIFEVKLPNIRQSKTGKIIYFVGAMTFGIYLLDPCLKLIFWGEYSNQVESSIPLILASFLWVLISMLVGTIITWVLKKIPIINKLF